MAKELIAGICTSGSRVKMALLAGGKCLRASRKALNQEKLLIPMLERMLKTQKAGLKDLSALCVIIGPGRFTGLRVALTFASAWRTLTGATVWSATLFDVLARQAAGSGEFKTWAAGKRSPRIAALVHAFKEEYFCRVFKPGPKGAFVPDTDALWLRSSEMTAYLASLGGDVFVVADAEECPDIYSVAPRSLAKAPGRISKIDPAYIIETGLDLKNKDISPLYLKPAKYELDSAK